MDEQITGMIMAVNPELHLQRNIGAYIIRAEHHRY